MSQKTINFADNPYGAVLMDDYLAPLQNNMLTSNSGESRPEYVQQGTKWLDTSSTPWLLKMYDGTDDVVIGTIDPSTHKFTPSLPLSNQGDLLVQGADGNPTSLPAGENGYVLTSNGPGELPSYKVPSRDVDITNCITGWREDIKWVINANRTITFLAGSKFYIPNGPGNYEEIVLAENKSMGPWNGDLGYVCLYYDVGSDSIQGESWNYIVSGETDTISNHYHLWFDTTNNIIKRYDIANQVIHAKCSFPLILVNMPSATNFSSVWRTFNGFSICGSSYILLPGLKAIFADGYNDDGSVKNIEIETDHISVFTRTWNSSPGINNVVFLSRSPQGATNLDPTIWWYNTYVVQGNEPMRGSENVGAEYTIWYNPDIRKTYYWGGNSHEEWMEFPGCLLMIGNDTNSAGGMKIANIVRGYVTPFVAADASKVMGKEQFQVVTSLPPNTVHNTFYFCTNA